MTQPMLDKAALRELIHRELPRLVREDPKICDLVIELSREPFTDDRDHAEGRIKKKEQDLGGGEP